MNTIEEIIQSLSVLKNLYDYIRVVDPVRKKVVDIREKAISISQINCYNFWNKSEMCDNCVSIRAFNEDNTFVKIEYNNEKVFMLLASPIKVKDYTYVVEIMKDITNTGIIEDVENKNISEIYDSVKRMNELVIRDELTHVYNKRYINERLPVDIFKSSAEHKPLSVIMADIDCFKHINDTYGHIIGDNILRDFSAEIVSCIRKEQDWVARYGGDEFLIALNNTDKESAVKVAEKLKERIEKRVFNYDDISITLTASFGICATNDDSTTLKELVGCADKNLYKAKNAGKNRVAV